MPSFFFVGFKHMKNFALEPVVIVVSRNITYVSEPVYPMLHIGTGEGARSLRTLQRKCFVFHFEILEESQI